MSRAAYSFRVAEPIPGAVIVTWEMEDKVSGNIRCSSVSSLLPVTSQTVMRFFKFFPM